MPKHTTKIVSFFFFILMMTPLLFAQETNYKIQPEDIIEITVYEHPDLKTRARISAQGDITFPLLGEIHVEGLTINELKDKLSRDLEKDYLVNAQVSVFIGEYHTKQVTVLGAVKSPGKYNMLPEKETTVLEVIAMAGGFSEVASINNTRVVRTENGEETIISVRVTDITKKGLKENDIALKPGDIIFVPESFF